MMHLGAITLVVGICLGAQAAPFQNLDFESANLPAIPYPQHGDLVPVSAALPGWGAYLGTDPVSSVYHNNVTLGPAIITVWGPDWPFGLGGRIEGNFTALLATGTASTGAPLSISQTGLVPEDARWLLFKGRADPRLGDFAVSLDGQTVPTSVLGSYPGYSLYGAEVQAFAGVEADLEFTVFRSLGNGLVLDSIEFSPVPEPGSLTLVALGLLAGVWWRRVHSRRARA